MRYTIFTSAHQFSQQPEIAVKTTFDQTIHNKYREHTKFDMFVATAVFANEQTQQKAHKPTHTCVCVCTIYVFFS